ncbi:MAG: FkbM family methyltransferase [Candidatus Micrarchaeaceae archaeon]
MRKRKIIKVILKNGDTFQWEDRKVWAFAVYKGNDMEYFNLFFTNSNNITFKYKGKLLNFTGTQNNGALIDVFLTEDYSFLRCENEDVVDIGANIGDSAVYFALNGAKKVIALEPYPYSYSSAELNIKNNKLSNIITLLNAGYGNDGTITVSEDFRNGRSDLVESKHGRKIPLYSLRSIIEQYNLQNPVLKMDCEGCEYNLLNEADEIIRKFKRIQIEYHYGYRNLKNKLESAGFKVTFTGPIKEYNKMSLNPHISRGYIYAEIL